MQKKVLFKKILPVALLCATILFSSIFSLKSTSFNQIYKHNKLIISMNPVYSDGDPSPAVGYVVPLQQSNTHNVYYGKINNPPINKNIMTQKKYVSPIQKIASSQPTSIIPHYVPQKKSFYKRHIVTVNSYLKNKPAAINPTNLAFQGKIPLGTNGIKHLRPITKTPVPPHNSYRIPIYKEYVSIER